MLLKVGQVRAVQRGFSRGQRRFLLWRKQPRGDAAHVWLCGVGRGGVRGGVKRAGLECLSMKTEALGRKTNHC